MGVIIINEFIVTLQYIRDAMNMEVVNKLLLILSILLIILGLIKVYDIYLYLNKKYPIVWNKDNVVKVLRAICYRLANLVVMICMSIGIMKLASLHNEYKLINVYLESIGYEDNTYYMTEFSREAREEREYSYIISLDGHELGRIDRLGVFSASITNLTHANSLYDMSEDNISKCRHYGFFGVERQAKNNIVDTKQYGNRNYWGPNSTRACLGFILATDNNEHLLQRASSVVMQLPLTDKAGIGEESINYALGVLGYAKNTDIVQTWDMTTEMLIKYIEDGNYVLAGYANNNGVGYLNLINEYYCIGNRSYFSMVSGFSRQSNGTESRYSHILVGETMNYVYEESVYSPIFYLVVGPNPNLEE